MSRPYALLRAGFPYDRTIGEFKTTSMPHDVAFGKEGRIYVLCGGNSGPIYITNLDDEDLGSFGVPGFGFRKPSYKASLRGDEPHPPEHIEWPVQMAVDSNEDIYVTDEGANRVVVYARDGRFIGAWGRHGSGDGELDRPAGIAFDPDDNVYVVDSLNHRVQKFSKDGRFLGKFGEHGEAPGRLNMPWGLEVDELGDLYVADWRNDRVQKFDSKGNLIMTIGTPGSRKGEMSRPSDVAVDTDGDIYVCDWGNNRVQMFNAEGRYIYQFRGDAVMSKSQLDRAFTRNVKMQRMREMSDLEQEKYFQWPRSVAVDSERRLFVPDFGVYRVQVYRKLAYPLTQQQIQPPFKSATIQNF
ncbi:MAG: hypothetical protein FJ319_14540 [SAR202 cluster bacterium]|nr:hypothetical protein [SAR202 cluster bacterium]